MPFLHEIEKQFSVIDGLVVIGIHSAKFPNEKVKFCTKGKICTNA